QDVQRFDVAEFARELASDLVRGSGRVSRARRIASSAVAAVPTTRWPPSSSRNSSCIRMSASSSAIRTRRGSLTLSPCW
ncbi:MAG: hypothetical protein EOO66_25095, partial [Methylobacterium sp.]